MQRTINKTTVQGHSIWLLPEPQAGGIIADTIATLANRFRAPIFRPHMTLLGQIPGEAESVLTGFREVADETKRSQVKIESLDMQDQFFRALFYKILHSGELDELHSAAESALSHQSERPFFPHLSLLYSSATRGEKEELISTVQIPEIHEITITHMALVKTMGEVGEWKMLEKIELK